MNQNFKIFFCNSSPAMSLTAIIEELVAPDYRHDQWRNEAKFTPISCTIAKILFSQN